ncbi:COG4315 family predicted lipoprotein [Psychrobacter sp. 1U2]|uniref:COG4315 family predicted lipoprotein n=1 Tax=Psychrobacter sp. 1U2 TaxID=3453577 RepID=UPI003F4572BA
MKNIMMLTAMSGVLALTGCSTIDNMFGTNLSSMNKTPTQTVPVTSKNGVLVGSNNNMTLYTFDKDTANMSNCKGGCLDAWPALTAPNSAMSVGQYSTFQRDDGSYQWAVNGKPLYYFVKDKKAGDMMGDNVKNVWHVVRTR